jgi:DNA polymerase (family 10)
LLEHLGELAVIERLEVAGSYRRRRETVGDIDLLAIASDAARVMEHFVAYPKLARVEMAGETRGRIALQSGLEVDLRILPRQSYGAALVYFTGSKEHNIRLRKRAIERGLRLSEYGVFRETDAVEEDDERDPWAGEMVAGVEEVEVYSAVDLPWIPPELREDRGEIEAAAADDLPELVELAQIRGDLQMHSTWSDGKNSIEEMLAGCVAKGYEYFAMTDHSKALAMTGGLDAERVRQQWIEISEVQERHPEIRILRSQEVDILADGSLDQDDEVLEELDLVVISVHSLFDLPAARQTRRVLAALQHPQVDILAHPTGRLINKRPPFELAVDEVLHCAKEHGVAVELNAHPDRLDLKDDHLMLARELGLKIAVSTDSHRVQHLDLMRYGVEQARRAWLQPRDVLNCLPLAELLSALDK